MISWKPLEKAGEFEVTASPDAPVGVHWIRIHESGGATVIKPFIIGTIAEKLEAEPNDQLDQSQLVDSLPVTINGVLEKAGDIDSATVELKQGQHLFAACTANQLLQSQVDMGMQIVDLKGNILGQNHDHFGLDPFIEFVAPYEGRFIIRVFGFPETADSTIGYAGRMTMSID